jgi:glycosyltransferase involved in cell wall biosynthesis
MELGSRRLEELKVTTKKFHWLPNGVNYEDFEGGDFKKNDKNSKSKKFTFGYIGSHGKANALDTIIDAGKYLKGSQIHILMIGGGSEKIKLQEKARLLSLDNITFLDRVPKEKVPSILKSMDGLLISWHNLEIYKYGTSANKLAEYFSAGKPVVQAYSGAGDNITKFNAGITVPAGNASAMADAMKTIAVAHEHELERYCINAQKAARENFTFKVLANKLKIILNTL